MLKKALLPALLFLLLAPAAITQDDRKPLIVILRYGAFTAHEAMETGLLDMLQAYEFINADERRRLEERRDLTGEKIDIIWDDADFSLPNVNLMIAAALDREADVLVTLTTPVTQVAVNATSYNIDDPPTVLFAGVYSPYEAGIAQAPCIKPAHVIGSEAQVAYEEIIPLLKVQDPDLTVIGTIYSSSETSGHVDAQRIIEVGESFGLEVKSIAITALTDLRPAMESLVNKGIGAVLLPLDQVTKYGLPIITTIASEYGIPVFHPNADSITQGATVSAGFNLYYAQGLDAGRLLTAHLNDAIDISTIAIDRRTGMEIGVNLDSAAMQGVEIDEELIERANLVIEDGELKLDPDWLTRIQIALDVSEEQMGELMTIPEGADAAELSNSLRVPSFMGERLLEMLASEEHKAADQIFLESLTCTPERIAAEQAELDAQSE